MKTLKIIAHLLAYPGEDLYAALPELAAALSAEDNLRPVYRDGLLDLIRELQAQPLGQLQERYVGLFDRGRHLSLHLFEHVHGESRDRGQAMVDLMEHYSRSGYDLDAKELPDYIPLFLEYLSTQPEAEITEMLADAMPVLVLLGARLQEKESSYASLFHALEDLGGSCEEARAMREQAATEGPDEAITNMDAIWEEEQVTFMANNDPAGGGGCSSQAAPAMPSDEMPIRWVDGAAATPARSR